MADPTHVEILRKGGAAWNNWLIEGLLVHDRDVVPDLSGADLRELDLREANLRGADLKFAKFDKSDLRGANLVEADLRRATLIQAVLEGADLNAARMSLADFGGANLRGAVMNSAIITSASFNHADLTGADLRGANLGSAWFKETVLAEAKLGHTIFADSDLSTVRGLETVDHIAPSTVGIEVLYKSGGNIPEDFLRDAGATEEVIELARSIRCGPPIQWHSCFISHSTKDEGFARRLHSRMQQANIRVFYAPKDLKGGKKLHEQLFEAIQMHDRLLIVLSEQSIKSEWVMTEIRKAREQERRENTRKLFPVRLVDFNTLRDWTCFDADTGKDLAVEVREYFIPDFSDWKNHDAFEASFAKLQSDLRAGA